jgi:hypothetical protein
MDKTLFVKKLKALAPSKTDFKGLEVSDDFIKELINTYNCPIKEHNSYLSLPTDPLLDLLISYDCSRVEIGLVRLVLVPEETLNYFLVGYVDADILSFNKLTHRVEVLDYSNPRHVIWECAENGGKFLEAMLACAEYLISNLKASDDEENLLNLKEYTDRCIDIAGGDEYEDFYKMLLGGED